MKPPIALLDISGWSLVILWIGIILIAFALVSGTIRAAYNWGYRDAKAGRFPKTQQQEQP